MFTCTDEPALPNVHTGDATQDFKNGTQYVYEVRDAGKDCREKLHSVSTILKGGNNGESSKEGS